MYATFAENNVGCDPIHVFEWKSNFKKNNVQIAHDYSKWNKLKVGCSV